VDKLLGLPTLDEFWAMPWPRAVAWLLGINVAMFVLSVLAGEFIARLYRHRRVTPPPAPLDRPEVVWAVVCVVLNGGVAIAGWVLWRAGLLHVRQDAGIWGVVLDVAVLFGAMDFLMYAFHRLAHARWLFPLVHSTHHRYDRPRPIDLFVLNPAEVLGFGALWLALLCAYPASWDGILIYLALNLVFGTLGHLGVEPYPAAWSRWPVLRNLGSSSFYAGHHQDLAVNFGFYTTLWDRLFGTLGATPTAAAPGG
jgi:Delta7-sterol 5-desaturase